MLSKKSKKNESSQEQEEYIQPIYEHFCSNPCHKNKKVAYISLSKELNSRFICSRCVQSNFYYDKILLDLDELRNNHESEIYNWPPILDPEEEKYQKIINANSDPESQKSVYVKDIKEYIQRLKDKINSNLEKIQEELIENAEKYLEKTSIQVSEIKKDIEQTVSINDLRCLLSLNEKKIESYEQKLDCFISSGREKFKKKKIQNKFRSLERENGIDFFYVEKQLKKYPFYESLDSLKISKLAKNTTICNQFLPFEKSSYRDSEQNISIRNENNIAEQQQLFFKEGYHFSVAYSQAFKRNQEIKFSFQIESEINFGLKNQYFILGIVADGEQKNSHCNYGKTGNQLRLGFDEKGRKEWNYSSKQFFQVFQSQMNIYCEINVEKNKMVLFDEEKTFFVENKFAFEEKEEKWRFVISCCNEIYFNFE